MLSILLVLVAMHDVLHVLACKAAVPVRPVLEPVCTGRVYARAPVRVRYQSTVAGNNPKMVIIH